MLRGILFLSLLGISSLVGLGVVAWSTRLLVMGKWQQCLSIVAAGLLAGLLAIGLLVLLFTALGETFANLPRETAVAVFVLGFSWGSFAMAVSLGLWPFVKELLVQSRRWADRR